MGLFACNTPANKYKLLTACRPAENLRLGAVICEKLMLDITLNVDDHRRLMKFQGVALRRFPDAYCESLT